MLATAVVDWIPSVAAVLVTIVIAGLSRVLMSRGAGARRHPGSFQSQLLAVMITVVGLLVAILLLPESIDSELAFSVVGLVLTGLVAISSQSIIANAMAGLMLRSVASFRAGDFIEVAGHVGRVSERGLFHTEIQTPDRDLVTLPNSLMVNEPVKVVRSSGTIVSMSVSLGYDISHDELRPLLREAGLQAELADPFVQILELGDYAVGYRVGGFLEDPVNLLSARSELRKAVLDTLTDAGIEIVSPVHIARREVGAEPMLPDASRKQVIVDVPAASAMVFDKAEAAGRLESARAELGQAEAALDRLRSERYGAAGIGRERLERAVAEQQRRVDELERLCEHLSATADDD